MKFEIRYTKLGNQFFFISNLTEWDFHCRKHYNQEWLKQTGLLTSQEKKILKKFGSVMKKYGFGRKNNKCVYLGIPFIASSEKQVWQKVKNWVKKKEYGIIKKTFKILEPRFNQIWADAEKQLKKIKQGLEKKLKEKKIKSALKYLSFLYNNKETADKIIEIYLLISPLKNNLGGGANLGPEKITLEAAMADKKTLNFLVLIVLHELIHLFEGKYFRPLLKNWVNGLTQKERRKIKKSQIFQQIKQSGNATDKMIIGLIINEIIASSLLPEGYLRGKIFKRENVKINIRNYFKNNLKSKVTSPPRRYRTIKTLRQYTAYHLYSSIKKYSRQKKSLNESYIKKAYRLFKRFERI